MRCYLIAVLGMLCLTLCKAEEEIRPLPIADESDQTVVRALIGLAGGDTTAFDALPIDAFLRPYATVDPERSGISQRWTRALPTALQRLPVERRQEIIAYLDARFTTLLNNATTPQDRGRLASAFLPAPHAHEVLRDLAVTAFDFGRLSDFLGIANLLPPSAINVEQVQTARRLTGWDSDVELSEHLSAPGPLATRAITVDPPVQQLAVRWETQPGWIMAVDPFASVIWQYQVDRLAQIVTGPGACVVRDSRGTRTINEAGDVQLLTPLPAHAIVRCIGGGAVWFVADTRVWRLELGTNQVNSFELPQSAIGKPIVRGKQSMWLTADQVVLCEQNKPIQTINHGKKVGLTWTLSEGPRGPVIIDARQLAWEITPLQPTLDASTPGQQITLLVESGQFAAAQDILKQAPESIEPDLRARVQIGCWIKGLAELPTATTTTSSVANMRLLNAQLFNSVRFDRRYTFEEQKILATLFAAQAIADDAWFTSQRSSLTNPRERWSHQFSAAAVRQWLSDMQQYASGPHWNRPLGDARLLSEEHIKTEANHIADRHLTLERTIDTVTLSCRNQQGALLWTQSWLAPSFHDVPSYSCELRDGIVYVQEADRQLLVYDGALGIPLGRFTISSFAGSFFYLPPGRLAILSPLGVNTTLTYLSAKSQAVSQQLPSPAQWACVIDDQLVLRLQHEIRALPSDRVLHWPHDIFQSTQPPRVWAKGLALGDRWWPWATTP